MFRKTVVARALSIAFGTAALTAAVMQPAMAQSNTTGKISGRVDAKPGVTVSVVGIDSGIRRTVSPEANGTFHLTALPIGAYTVSVVDDGKVVASKNVEVRIGGDAEADFGLQTVQITGRRNMIDVTSSAVGASFTARELAVLPIAPQVANVVQLAAGTTRGDYRFGNNAASFGGSSAAENAAYVNGFPITSSLYQVGYTSLPFGAIAEAQVITGGYGAEFGRSTGGVINITTKSGSNTWEVGAGFTWAPAQLRAKAKNIMYPVTGASYNAGTDGKIWNYKAGDQFTEKVYNVSLGGPLIKDKLFLFVAGELTDTKRETQRLAMSGLTNGTNGWLEQFSSVPRTLAKVDWNITDNHRLELTHITDESNVRDKYYGFNTTTLQRNYVLGGGASFKNYASGVLGLNSTGAALSAPQGANLDILKYTGYITDDLTVQALVGRAKTAREQIPIGYIPGQRPITAADASRAPGINYTPTRAQGFTGALLRDDAHDENKGYRLDVEWKVLPKHTVRAGIDHNKITALAGTAAAGGGTWNYLKIENPNQVLSGHNMSPAAGGGLGRQGYYVDENIQIGGSTPSVIQSAQYIEDKFQATPNLLLTFGLRSEGFNNMNGAGETFVEQKHMLAPRFNAAWNVYGDGSLKATLTAGRYHLQLPANLAVRFAGVSINTDRFYTYTGVDPVTGAPLGLNPISNVLSANNEFGAEQRANELAANGLKAHFQDEINLGLEKQLSPNWRGGIRVTYRTLKNTIDDVSDVRPILAKLSPADRAYLEENGWHGALFNPGKTNTFTVPINATGGQKQVTVTAAEMGFPEDAIRTYKAVELTLEHPMRNGWYGKFNYVWSRSFGNQEGQTKSDNGQPDVGFSSLWDFPETMINGTGLLPNDRTHQIKAFGVYEFTPQFSMSGNALVATGRPKSLTCNIPTAMDNQGLQLFQYGSIFYLCPGMVNGRGAQGRLPTDTRLDLAFMYRPAFLNGLLFKADVLNVFDRQITQAIDEAYNVRNAGDKISPTAGQVLSYSPPRSVRLSVQYNHKF
jgi:hypothetical protein